MMSNFVKRLSLCLILLLSLHVSAQYPIPKFNEDKSVVTLQVDIDRARLEQEDLNSRQIGTPMRFALFYPLEINAMEIGKWENITDSEKIWKLTIESPQSHGIMIQYDDFYIPKGAKLYVYNEDSKYDIKFYTHDYNPEGGIYSTGTTSGDKITLEYVASANVTEMPRFQISSIGYQYRDLSGVFYDPNSKLKYLNDPYNSCIPNINCAEGIDWQSQKKGVVRMIINVGGVGYFCTGSLVNNTKKDKTPYVLSAYHCFYPPAGPADVDRTEFYFNDEFLGCENEKARPAEKKLIGAEALVMNPLIDGSDGALVKITKNIPTNWSVHYNGWEIDNRDNVNVSGAVIQHPLGDVKKIALYATPLKTGTWTESSGSSTSNAHWMVRYSVGVTQKGSSGSPIFNQNGLIVGSLTGGSSDCTNLSGFDYYGKFAYNWDKSSDTNLWMKNYLDPDNTGITKLLGMDSSGNVDPDVDPIEVPSVFLYWEGDMLNIAAQDILKKVRVINLKGYVVHSMTGFKSSVHIIPTFSWNKGVYIITVDTQNGISKKIKVVK